MHIAREISLYNLKVILNLKVEVIIVKIHKIMSKYNKVNKYTNLKKETVYKNNMR